MEVQGCARHWLPTHTQADAARGGEAEAPGAAAREVRAYVACAHGPRSLRRAFLFSFVFFCVVFPLCGVNCSGLGRPFSEAVIHGEIFQQSRFHCSKRHETRDATPGPRSVRRAYLFSLVFSVLFPPYPYVSRPVRRARGTSPRYDEISSQIKLAHRVRSRPNHAL